MTLIFAGVLMILLGLARAAGGAVLLVQKASADPRIQATDSAVTVLGVLLIGLGAGLVATAVGVLRQSRRAWLWSIGLVIAFVIDGMINGYVFFGRPGDQGTAVNILVAALILICLALGRTALKDTIVVRRA